MSTNKELKLLKRYFGHKSFRPLQAQAVEAIINGEDLLMILPTGGGKSLCYQLPAISMRGVAVVISPLLALMHDQVTALKANGIEAEMLSSMQDTEELKSIEYRLLEGEIKLLYIAPEKLSNIYFQNFLRQLDISFFVVDEAHCLSEWGHEFREDYRKLNILRQLFPDKTIASFTATATPQVKKDIINQLKLNNPIVLKGSLFRSNLTIHIKDRVDNGHRQLLSFLYKNRGESGIIYTSSRKQSESLAIYLREKGFKSDAFHAGLEVEEKRRVYKEFVADRINIVVATIAFGMGIDKSNIRFVVHMSMPKTIESYYQEIGRAGRDGLESETLLLFNSQDIIRQNRFIEELPDGLYKQTIIQKIAKMALLCRGDECRHRQIALYFGDNITPCKNHCDNCKNPSVKKRDITIEAQKMLSAIYRTGQKYPLRYIIDLLRGSKNKSILENEHNKLSVYAIGKEYNRSQWLTIADKLLEINGMDINEYSHPYITHTGKEILLGNIKVDIASNRLKTIDINEILNSATKKALHGTEYAIFDRLRALRKEIAQEEDIPPYIIFSDKTLKEMAQFLPTDDNSLLSIHGIGYKKAQKYGERFLELIKEIKGESLKLKI